MRHTVCILSIYFTQLLLSGQSLLAPLSVTCTAGSSGEVFVNGGARTMEWTLGEVFIYAGNLNDVAITHGEQQGIKNVLQVGTNDLIFSPVKIFPNPVNQFLTINEMPEGKKRITLHSSIGLQVFHTSTIKEYLSIPTTLFSTGLYILTIQLDHNQFHTYKIIIL